MVCQFEKICCVCCDKEFKRNSAAHLIHKNFFIVQCPNNCEWTGACTRLRQHLNEYPTDHDEAALLDGCDYVKVKCPYCHDTFERQKLKEKFKRVKESLSETDLRLVLAFTWDARAKWYNIGLELGIDPSTLDAIKSNNNRDCELCYRELLLYWLRSTGEKTWKVLVNALKSRTVGYEQLSVDTEKGVICKNVEKREKERLINEVDKKADEARKLQKRSAELKRKYKWKNKST